VAPARQLDFRTTWDSAFTYEQFFANSEQNLGLWDGVYRTTAIPDWARQKIIEHGGGIRLLIIAEDWCGDAANTVPVLARFGAEVDGVEVRIIQRDEHPDVMDRYLTNGARSIPIAILLGEDFNELGHWGPRPRELQQWVMENKDIITKEERYPQVRRWYAKDKGEATLREVLELL
jgi:hypothetical protein